VHACFATKRPLFSSRSHPGFGVICRTIGQAPNACAFSVRHMLVLEDVESLRLLPGVTDLELQSKTPCKLTRAPTKFGRIDLQLEPIGRSGWT
jgi:hypothetical protein